MTVSHLCVITRRKMNDASVCTTVDSTGALRTIRMLGNRLYVRHCKGADTKGGIVIPEKSHDLHEWVEILAVGPGVGDTFKPRDPRIKKIATRRWDASTLTVGTLVHCKEQHPDFIKQSPFSRHEYIITADPDVLLMTWEGGDTNSQN